MSQTSNNVINSRFDSDESEPVDWTHSWRREIEGIVPENPPEWHRGGRVGESREPARGLDWFAFASTYEKAAGVLVGRLPQLPTSLEHIPPVVFLCRHVVELMLKHFLHEVQARRGDASRAPRHHDLVRLWRGIRDEFRRTQDDATSVDLVEQLVETIGDLDPRSFEFRYPANQPAEDWEVQLPVVDVIALHDAVVHFMDVMTVASDRLTLLERHGYASWATLRPVLFPRGEPTG